MLAESAKSFGLFFAEGWGPLQVGSSRIPLCEVRLQYEYQSTYGQYDSCQVMKYAKQTQKCFVSY